MAPEQRILTGLFGCRGRNLPNATCRNLGVSLLCKRFGECLRGVAAAGEVSAGGKSQGGSHMRHVPEGSGTAQAEAPLRVIVADDDPLARRVVRDALEAGGIVVIAEGPTGGEAGGVRLDFKPG